ncbi:MAG: hypothetical protein OXM55_00745 [Bdellovibrionales bacterium]|nr:hypothetical protein [Bdellovibrionales bacterium]
MRCFIYLLLWLLYLLGCYHHPTLAIKTQASDIDYYIHSNPSFTFIFNENFLNNKKENFLYIYKKVSYYDDIYKEVFTKKLKDKPIYIFASPKNQISNAVTSSIPFLRVLFFPTGVEKMNDMATIAWEDTVIAHEMAHVFQLGQISDHLKYLSPIFKNSEVIFLPIPIFLNVNLIMPLFFLEGHAVLSESLFAPGGRLYSGSTRALVFSQIKNLFKTGDQFIKNYLINHTEDTFSIEQQYVHGGYFFSSLLKKYDIKTVNNIFKQHAEHFIIPLSFISIKSIFKSTFNNSFESLLNYYIQTYLPLASQQKKSAESVLFKSHICPPFNKSNNEVFFLSSNLKSTPVLRTLNMETGIWKKDKKIFSKGKIFKMEGRYYVSSSDKINTTERAYGLFSEGMYLVKKYKSQYIQDIYEDQILSIDTTNNMHGFDLLLNGEFYDKINSSALFDSEGRIYYFKQNGTQRMMYRDKEPLFQFKGFYGKPVEIDQDGTVYFIASSLLGSSLFAWHNSIGIYRISSSDTIIEAIPGIEGQFLVCEVEPHFYTYKLITPTILNQQPAFYDYSFEKIKTTLSTVSSLSLMKEKQTHFIQENLSSFEDKKYLKKLEEIDMAPEGLSSTSDTVEHKSKSQHLPTLFTESLENHLDVPYSAYSSLWQIRFNGLELGLSQDPITGYNGLVNIAFRDPMEYNTIQFAYQKSLGMENWGIQSKYINQAYRLSWDIQHLYKEGLENFSGARAYAYVNEFSLGFLLPLFKRGYWQSSLYTKSAISRVEFKKLPGEFWYFGIEPSLTLTYGRKYKKNFDFHRQFFTKTSLQYHFKFSNKDSNYRLKVQSYYTMHLGWEVYTTPFVTYQTALKSKSIPFRYFVPLELYSNAELLNSLRFFLRERAFEETNDYLSAGMRWQKFLEMPLYFSRFPLSLIGIAPVLSGKYIQFLSNDKDKQILFLEWTFGVKIGVLFHHKIKTQVHLYYGYSYPLDSTLLGSGDLAGNKIKKTSHHFNNNRTHFGLRLTSDF